MAGASSRPPRPSQGSATSMDEDDIAVSVELYVYDMTKGMAAMMSRMLIGRQIDGIWHTAIVAYGREYFFGSAGIQSCRPGNTILQDPQEKLNQGETFIPYQVFVDYILGLGQGKFAVGTYDLLSHNCNTFSNEVSQFLCGTSIPKHIIDLPSDILNTPFGQSIIPLLESLNGAQGGGAFGQDSSGSLRNYQPQDRNSRVDSPEFDQLNSAIEESRRTSVALEERRNEINEKLAKKERKKKKKRQKGEKHSRSESSSELTPDSGSNNSYHSSPSPRRAGKMSDTEGDVEPVATNGGADARRMLDDQAEIEAEEKKEADEKKRNREPPIVFKDAVDVRVEFDALVGHVDGILNPEEQQSLEELHQYMLEDEGSWALGDGFLNFVGRLLHDKSLKPEVRVHMLNVLAAAALKDDVILLLHQDRREHILMNYAHDVDRLSLEEQQSLALFMVNMFENLSSSEWLLYISEWPYCNQTISNIRVTTKVAVNCLLADNPLLQDRGTAIIHNLACKEVKSVVFDDVAVEITMALLQYFNSSPSEENLFRCMKALARFCHISPTDVPQLIQMIGPEPSKFRGASPRVDEQIALVAKKMR